MRLSTYLLLPAFLGLASASALSDAAVYIFQNDDVVSSLDNPTLTPEQARLVFAQRLGVSKYHGLGDASEVTLSYIRQFGGRPTGLFEDSSDKQVPELLMIVEGIASEIEQPLFTAKYDIKPSFSISGPPSISANKKLLLDLQRQSGQTGAECALEGAVNPLDKTCWEGKTKVIHLDLAGKHDMEEMAAIEERLNELSAKHEMNSIVVLMPPSSRTSISGSNPYGKYETDQESLGRRQAAEEPITEESPYVPSSQAFSSVKKLQASSPDVRPITGVPPLCHTSLEACSNSTNNCSGHGECYKKSSGENPCFTCGCRATNETITYDEGKRTGWTKTYWAGSACHKRDVSSAFWLIATFSVVMVGIISWGIGLLFSIGEEKLPGVIGAGVPSKSR